jgi:mono/diheme cytochrome c family protein
MTNRGADRIARPEAQTVGTGSRIVGEAVSDGTPRLGSTVPRVRWSRLADRRFQRIQGVAAMAKGLLIAVLVVSIVAPALATDDAGRTLYLRYCAACHGRDGRGDGPVAAALGEKPTDLTQIAAAHEGQFPLEAVVEAIDGTRTVRAHGVSEMPVWGEVFRPDPGVPLDQQVQARGQVLLIAAYLRTLQGPRPSH